MDFFTIILANLIPIFFIISIIVFIFIAIGFLRGTLPKGTPSGWEGKGYTREELNKIFNLKKTRSKYLNETRNLKRKKRKK